jgi:hypothetical protein
VAAEAYKQFKETEDWRNANQLDLLYRTIDLEHYEETRKLVRAHVRVGRGCHIDLLC